MFKYQKIIDDIREDILKGKYPGKKLPSTKEFANIYNVSIITIKKALQELEQEKLITVKHGSGIYISENKAAILRSKYEMKMAGFKWNARNLDYENKVATFKIIKATSFLADTLGLSVNDEVFEIIRLRVVEGINVQYEKTYIPVSLYPNLSTDDLLNSLFEYINAHGPQISHSHDLIGCKNATDIDKYYLNLKDSTALGTLEQIGWLENNVIFQYSYCVFIPEFFRFKFINQVK